jgi:geranylgeranyl diphosphate synthase type I
MRELLEQWRPVIDEAIAEVLPREVDDDYLADFFGAPTYAYDAEAAKAAITELREGGADA